jgi:hypothetical protein
MPPLTTSRSRQIASAADAFEARVRGYQDAASEPFAQIYERFATAVADVNTSLSEVRDLLRRGLRDEALSMHDLELVSLARRLGTQDRADWVRVHGWLLEQGMPVPAEIDVATADDFEAAAEGVQALSHHLDTLRRLALERAPLEQRLAVLRELRSLDEDNPVWRAAIVDHERAAIEDFRRQIPRAKESRDIDTLAAIEKLLTDPAWQTSPPASMVEAVQGASHVAGLRACVAQAHSAATEMAALLNDSSTQAAAVDALVKMKDRLEEAAHVAAQHVHALGGQSLMLAIAKAEGNAEACKRIYRESEPLLEKTRILESLRDTRKAFQEGCQRLEHLCDHLPERSDSLRWLAEVQRTELLVRRCCQDIPDLAMPPLLQERVFRASAAVESQESLSRRFNMVVAALGVGLLLFATAFGGLLLWRRAEWKQTLFQLKNEVAAAQAGHHRQRPPFVEQLADRYGSDPLVASLVQAFDKGVDGERDRTRRFEELMATHAEQLDRIRTDVGIQLTEAKSGEIPVWPDSLVSAAGRLAEAWAIGGLPEQLDATDSQPSPAARRRFQAEQDRLELAKQTLTDQSRRLEQTAVRLFTSRIDKVRSRLIGVPSAAEIQQIRDELASLRVMATTPRGEAADLHGRVSDAAPWLREPRVPRDVSSGLEAVEQRVETILREESP